MNWRPIMGGAVAVAVVVSALMAGATVLSGATAVHTIHAAPATHTRATLPTYGVPHETSKVVLPETSNDGPAFWTLPTESSPTGTLAVIAWTGTDAGHHINVLYAVNFSSCATNYVKATLAETAVGGAQIGFVPSKAMLVAWTGTDTLHHLNVAMISV